MTRTYSESEMIEAKRISFEDGERHSKPSESTEKFINMTEKRLELLDFRMKGMEENMKQILRNQEKTDEKFDKLIDKLDERYASKATEVAVNRIGWIVISAVVIGLLGLVVVK